MTFFYYIIISILIFFSSISYAKDANQAFNDSVNKTFSTYFNKYQNLEYYSGAQLSIYLPNQPIKNFNIGQVTHDENSKKIADNTLFQIGSITKSFTAAMILQLEKEGHLTLDDTIKTWLPAYPKWSNISIKSLLNMTAGLPNYSDTPMMNAIMASDLGRGWGDIELIDFVYPKGDFSPPLKQGYFYSNTNYILAGLIIEKITKNDFKTELENRTIKRANLTNTFYPVPDIHKKITERLAHGYNYNQYDNPVLVGRDIHDNNLSWAGPAGAVLANSEDVIKWVKALYIDNTILDAQQKEKLKSIVSLNTGKPIKQVDKDNPRGFGLGVVEAFDAKDPSMRRYWFYEGQTLGFRAVYAYLPCNGVIISTIFNSATNSENDHIGELMSQINSIILKAYPKLACK